MLRQLLIIDDEEDILHIIQRELVKIYPCTVHTATTSVETFNVLEQSPVELIISDVRLADELGFNLLQGVRSRYPHIGLMMMTAYRSSQYRRLANELGVLSFIEKPFAISTLAKTIERFFTQREAAQQPAG